MANSGAAPNTEQVSSSPLVTTAQQLADDVLFPKALGLDASGRLPIEQLDRIAEAGLYGLTGPSELGGAGADTSTLLAVIEALASGCLTTCFIWVQHQGGCRATAASTGQVRSDFAEGLSKGRIKAGVAFAHLMRPDPPMITAEPTEDGWLFNGTAPWVTGWGYIDVFHVAARHGDDIVWALIDARESPSLSSELLKLAAIDASGTFEIKFDTHAVDAGRITSIQPFGQWQAEYPHGLRVNGSLSLGVARRAASLLGSPGFDSELADARAQLDEADVDALPEARGRVSALTVRLTTSLIASEGGRAIVGNHHAQRLAREALFLLIQGQTPGIRQAQLRYL